MIHFQKAALSRQLVDTTVAGILITLSSQADPVSGLNAETACEREFNSIKIDGMRTLAEIKARISQELSDINDDVNLDADLLNKDKSACTTEELDHIRYHNSYHRSIYAKSYKCFHFLFLSCVP